MSRRAALVDAAHWALSDDEAPATAPPRAAADVQATLDDPALVEALEQSAGFGRLSDGDIRAMRAARRRGVAAFGVVALVSVVGIGGWKSGWLAGGPAPVIAHYETPRGQPRDIRLADGTSLHLDGATSVDVTLDRRQRLVVLDRGEAYFDVAHEADRPFVVHAAASEMRVLGTAFNVDIGRGDVRLAVYRGRVRFGGTAANVRSVDIPAGWRSRFSDGVVRAPRPFDASQEDWRQDWIDVDDMQLGDLVDALNRRGGPRVIDPPPGLAGIALSGRFKLDKSRQLLEAIGTAYGFTVAVDKDELRLVAAR
jgi:transmembrane sensor